MTTSSNCPFCNMDERIIKENEHANLFLSNPRKVEGHALVTPKRHVEKPWELKDEEILAIFELIKFAQKKLVKKYSGGCDVKQHYRPFMKQGKIKIDHVHYHVYPRTWKDELYENCEKYETDMFIDLSSYERKEVEEVFTD